MKWSDFVHFYTLGDAVRERDVRVLYDAAGLHERQVRLIPESQDEVFLQPAYPPQTALVFAPLSRMPFMVAGWVWALASLATYCGAALICTRPKRTLGQSLRVCVLALAFPPVWFLFAGGQSTAIPIVAFLLAWWRLSQGRRFLAGLCGGLVLMKPQLALGASAILLLCGEWRILAGGAVSATGQAVAVAALWGWDAWRFYLETVLPRMMTALPVIEPMPYHAHSLAAMTRQLPSPLNTGAWACGFAAVVVLGAMVWRRVTEPGVRVATLVVASVLVSPHVYIYDLSLLVLPWSWMWSALSQSPPWDFRLRALAFAVALSSLIPTARALPGFQMTVVAMLLSLTWLVVYARPSLVSQWQIHQGQVNPRD